MKRAYISKIVKASGVKAGEMILLHFWGEDADKEVANEFAIAVAAMGATPVVLQQARSVNREIFANATADCFGERYMSFISGFDAVMDIFVYQPVVLGDKLEDDKMELYRSYMARLFQTLMGAKRFTQIRIPTAENAKEADLEPEDYICRMEKAYDIDYEWLFAECTKACERLQPMQKVVLKTGEHCELFFDLQGRKWYVDAGDGDWPCGEVYIAPQEEKTHGTVFFEQLFLEDAGEYTEVVLQIEDGKIIGSNHAEVAAYFEQLAAEEKVVCELGLGMNPNVTELCGYTVLDEKKANTFHIAVGANQMFGGQNTAAIHMDMVGGSRFEICAMEEKEKR